MKSARSYALDVLLAVEKSGAYPGPLLQKISKDKSIHFGLLQRLVKGTLQQQSRIDSVLSAELRRHKFPDLKSIPPELKLILRIAAYQFLFLEDVPRKLVVVESLQLAKSSGKRREGLDLKVILNDLASGGSSLLAGAASDSFADRVSATGHPLWLAQKVAQLLGEEEALAFCEANNQPWPVSARANWLQIFPGGGEPKAAARELIRRLKRQGVLAAPGRLLEECVLLMKLPARSRLTELAEFKNGLMQVQDESAALIVALLSPKAGEFVIDLCAAPGGKATHAAALMRDRGEVLALDLHPSRVSLIKQNCRRLRLRSVRAVAADALSFEPARLADRVLLDAPCSGFGTLGRKIDIRWQRGPEQIAELVSLQRALLDRASCLVRPGGVLAYSTCTVLREENEDQVLAFLAAHPEFHVISSKDKRFERLRTKEGFYRTWPQRNGVGGAFVALLRRQDS